MKYGRHQIDKAGETMLSGKKEEDVSAAILKINDWRTLHLKPLDALQKSVLDVMAKSGIKSLFISRRLKRLTSIIYKLDINPQMRLGGMQDIGGFRMVLSDVEDLTTIKKLLEENTLECFTLDHKWDYIESPKTSGYRSIHYIYKYESSDNDVNGMKIEFQIRTKLQHSWAMAVETAELITKTRLKSSQGDDKWLNFFKIVSSLFAIKEKLPIMLEHRDKQLEMVALMKLLYSYNDKYKFSDKLKALRISIDVAKQEKYKNGYYILDIDFTEQRVKIKPYPKENQMEATSEYNKREKDSEETSNAVVLVSVPKMKELQEAYPSYFLDTKDFLEAIDKMMKNCKALNIV